MNIEYPQLALYIDGEWTQGSADRCLDVVDPADGSVLGRLPMASSADLDRALAAAQAGFEQWRRVAPAKRVEVLLTAARLVRERADLLAGLTALEEGLPFPEAKQYALRAVDLLEWDAGECRRLYGRTIPSEPGIRLSAHREPVGPVAAFTPWNAPVVSPCRKISNALAAGCSIILKAAEETPAATMALVQILIDAGVPPGVLNLVYGDPAMISHHLIDSPVIRMVAFTGSVPVGSRLAQQAGARLKPALMELGGHAPVIVCADADIEKAVKILVPAKFRNGGQACVAPTRFYLHESIHDRFVDAFVAGAGRMRIGTQFEPGVELGPLANPRRVAAVEALIEDAVGCGARLLCGGKRLDRPGYFYPPTVLADVPARARILAEEPFGPVAAMLRYSDREEVVARANALPFGLAGYVFTDSASQATFFSERLECGTIGINHTAVTAANLPFGGVKDSGFGREGGMEGVAAYTVLKAVSHALG